jgi:hypothetical protein
MRSSNSSYLLALIITAVASPRCVMYMSCVSDFLISPVRLAFALVIGVIIMFVSPLIVVCSAAWCYADYGYGDCVVVYGV